MLEGPKLQITNPLLVKHNIFSKTSFYPALPSGVKNDSFVKVAFPVGPEKIPKLPGNWINYYRKDSS
jgi:hypothetical protein